MRIQTGLEAAIEREKTCRAEWQQKGWDVWNNQTFLPIEAVPLKFRNDYYRGISDARHVNPSPEVS